MGRPMEAHIIAHLFGKCNWLSNSNRGFLIASNFIDLYNYLIYAYVW